MNQLQRVLLLHNIEQCKEFVNKYGFPVIIRPAYHSRGNWGGIAVTMKNLIEICERGINISPIGQILIRTECSWMERN